MDWRGEATATVYPQEDGEPGGSWWNQEGAALGTAVAGDGLKLTILRTTGLLVDLSRVRNIYDALDARSADYEVFSPMFEGPGSPELAGELQEELASYSSQVVLVDRVWLAPAWRGHGVGRLLTARLLGWVCPDPMVVALMPSPIALDEEQQEDEEAFNQEMAKVRRTWKSVGFRPFGKDIMVMDPAMADHGEAADKLARELGLPQ
jgi:GNAT superfamily N-acetyltransferase